MCWSDGCIRILACHDERSSLVRAARWECIVVFVLQLTLDEVDSEVFKSNPYQKPSEYGMRLSYAPIRIELTIVILECRSLLPVKAIIFRMSSPVLFDLLLP